jgi:hypothetical protein
LLIFGFSLNALNRIFVSGIYRVIYFRAKIKKYFIYTKTSYLLCISGYS